jgi:hypothetical protein
MVTLRKWRSGASSGARHAKGSAVSSDRLTDALVVVAFFCTMFAALGTIVVILVAVFS